MGSAGGGNDRRKGMRGLGEGRASGPGGEGEEESVNRQQISLILKPSQKIGSRF